MTAADRFRSLVRHLPTGDRLGEAFYAVWMAVVSVGLINSAMEITPAVLINVVIVCFVVNIVWGIIDGITVMYTNIMDRAERDRIVHRLRSGDDPDALRMARAQIEDSIVSRLGEAEKERIVAAIAAGAPGADPAAHRYRAGIADWRYALGILAIDVGLVVPVILPLLIVSDIGLAIYLSRLVATAIFAAVGWAYARNLNRNPWLAALFLGVLGFGLFTWAFGAGW